MQCTHGSVQHKLSSHNVVLNNVLEELGLCYVVMSCCRMLATLQQSFTQSLAHLSESCSMLRHKQIMQPMT